MDHLWDVLVWFLLHRVTRYVASWLLALTTGFLSVYYAWSAFDSLDSKGEPLRTHGNSGHCTIDFGGQWLMGAMLVQGHGQQLYDRRQQRQVLEAAYPQEEETPEEKRPTNEKGEHDASNLMSWFMGHEDHGAFGPMLAPLAAADPLSGAALAQAAWTPETINRAERAWVGGPLYPPINAFVYAPLGMLDPYTGYRTNQILCVIYAFGAGLGVSYLSKGRFWWPLAATLIMIYPGFKGAIHLGQNPPLTLLVLIWGWALIARNRPVLGGIVWGLLAFKPVWALAFILVPFISLRWRVCVAMGLTGIAQILATLPFVGVHSWLHWLQVGQAAAALYKTDKNWVYLSRDILGIPRRFLLDFSLPSSQRDVPLDLTFPFGWHYHGSLPSAIGWAMLLTIVGLTILLAFVRLRQARRAVTGPIAAFLLLGAWMSCFHFMYYDVLLTALALFVLLADPGEYLRPIFLAILPVPRAHLGAEVTDFYRPRPPREYPSPVPLLLANHRHLWVVNRMVPTVLLVLLFIEHFLTPMPFDATVSGTIFGTEVGFQLTTKLWHDGYPWDTFTIMFLWLWCAFLWLRTPAKPAAEAKPSVPGADVLPVSSGEDAAQPVELDTNVWGGHEGFADQYRPDARGLQP